MGINQQIAAFSVHVVRCLTARSHLSACKKTKCDYVSVASCTVLHFPKFHWNQADHFLHSRMGLGWRCGMQVKKCSLPECAAENIPPSWQHELKIALNPLNQNYRIFVRQALDSHPFWSRFDVAISTDTSHSSLHHQLSLLWSVSLSLYQSTFSLSLFGGFTNQLLMDFISQLSRKPSRIENPSSSSENHHSHCLYCST